MTYIPLHQSIIGAEKLNCRVRDGIGCCLLAIKSPAPLGPLKNLNWPPPKGGVPPTAGKTRTIEYLYNDGYTFGLLVRLG